MNFLIDYYWRSLKLLVKPYLKFVFVNKAVAVTVTACLIVNILGSTGYAAVTQEDKEKTTNQSVLSGQGYNSPSSAAQDNGLIKVEDKNDNKIYLIDSQSKEVVGFIDEKTGNTTKFEKGSDGKVTETVYDQSGNEVSATTDSGNQQGVLGAFMSLLQGAGSYLESLTTFGSKSDNKEEQPTVNSANTKSSAGTEENKQGQNSNQQEAERG